MKVTAIVLAAGKGSRMNSDVKKQYIEVSGKPIVWYTIRAFENSSVDEIILVTGKNEQAYCKKLVDDSGFDKVKEIVVGGEERYNSVYAGLCVAEDADYVLIHDGARPLIQVSTIEKTISRVVECDACVVAVQVKDTIKEVSEDGVVENTPDRKKLWSVQTPQAFAYNLVKNAYDEMLKDEAVGITDDAMVVELYSKIKVKIVEGEYTNIKVTTPEDLMTVNNFFKKV